MQALAPLAQCAAPPRRTRSAQVRCSAAPAPHTQVASSASAAPLLARRVVLVGLVAAAPLTTSTTLPLALPLPARADEVDEGAAWGVAVTVTLSAGAGSAEALLDAFPAAALYLTIRPPGRSPPLAARRVPLSSLSRDAPLFPLRLVLGAADALPDAPEQSLWAAAPQLVVSARLDTDGTAATRGPEDLVGRGAAPRDDAAPSGWGEARVELVGRGFGGRLVTQRSEQ